MRITTVSSGRITTQALISGEPSAARTISGPPNGILRRSASPPPTAAVLTTKERRFIFGTKFMCPSLRVRRGVNRRAHLLDGAAWTNVGGSAVGVLVGCLRVFTE